MTGGLQDFFTAAHAATALAHVLAAALLWRARRPGSPHEPQARLLLATLLASAAWAACEAAAPLAESRWAWRAAAALDLARYGLWFAFVLRLLKPGLRLRGAWRQPVSMEGVAALCWGLAALAWLVLTAGDEPLTHDTAATRMGGLAMAITGALLTEQLFRNQPQDARWYAKPVCLGLAVIFAFDIFLFAEAVLLGQTDPQADAVRGVVHALALPLLYVGAARRGDWVRGLQVSHTAAFYSATLLLSGGYLLFMAAVGYYVRLFGGEWGRALQMGLLAAALLGLVAFVFSHSMRARLRVAVHKHFFSYRYDYRQEWLHFTAMLSSHGSPQEMGVRVVRGLANMVDCPGGALWMRAGDGEPCRQAARWNQSEVREAEPADSPFIRYLREKAWVIDLDEYRRSPRLYGELQLPLWLLTAPDAWVVVPLLVGDELLGFVTLVHPRTPIDLDWEVRDLLKTASRQAAGFLAQMQATEALLEARKFEAFNRMSAFVVHDLKNIVTQLALMLKNAERLHANAEFQQDMLLTVGSSVEKMKRLMLQLREGAAPPGGTSGVDLAAIAGRLQAAAQARGRSLQVDIREKVATRGHDERLERVLGHLVQNAMDATPAEGRVWLAVGRRGGQVEVEIGDTGAGMTEEFVKTRLFRPFSTTKAAGMGIGSYESAQYLRELGGAIAVDSAPGRGTVLTVTLPLFDAQATSHLSPGAQA